jgi:hypothetical protein
MAIHPFARGPLISQESGTRIRSPHVSVSDLDAVGRSFSAGRISRPTRLTARASHPSKPSPSDSPGARRRVVLRAPSAERFLPEEGWELILNCCLAGSQLRGPSRLAGCPLVGFGAEVASGSSGSIMAISSPGSGSDLRVGRR